MYHLLETDLDKVIGQLGTGSLKLNKLAIWCLTVTVHWAHPLTSHQLGVVVWSL